MKTLLLILLTSVCAYSQPSPCQHKIDSLQMVIKVQNYRINRIRYYTNICNKRPSQDKFLKGWINRALK